MISTWTPARLGVAGLRTMGPWLAALFLAVALSACGGGGDDAVASNEGAPPTGNAAKAKWTYLVYIAGDNSLSDAVDINLAQMKAARSSADVRVVVMMEQSRTLTPTASANTRRGTVERGASQLADMGRNVNMRDKANLSEFIKWGKQTYPADRYAVVMWSHGGGWKSDKLTRGALVDDASSTEMMSVKDIAWALQDAGGADLLNFDACLMGMYEVAFELRHAAKILVASEGSIPGSGNPYDRIINRLVDSPAMDAAALGTAIVNEYDAFYRARNRESVQLASIDLSRVDALDVKVRELSALLIASLPTDRINIEASRDASVSYTYENNHDLVGFATALSTRSASQAVRTKALELIAATRAAVLANKVLVAGTEQIGNSNGLAIYIPTKNVTTTSELGAYLTSLSSNVATAVGNTWNDFVLPMVTGSSGAIQTSASGAFAYGITWDNPDVDLDLYVNEPDGNWAGPAWSTTSVNAFSSADSYDSGEAGETYTGNDALARGGYDVFVYYAGCHAGKVNCGATNVSVVRFDPTRGDVAPVVVATRRMAPLPAMPDDAETFDQFIAAASTNNYADWLYVQRTVRALDSTQKVSPWRFKARAKSLREPVQK